MRRAENCRQGAGLDGSFQLLHDRLSQSDLVLAQARAAGAALEQEKEELRVQLSRASRARQTLQVSFRDGQHAVGDLPIAHTRLERHSQHASGEVLAIKAQVDAELGELQALELDSESAVAALECSLAASRHRTKEIAEEASAARRQAWSSASELADARQRLAAIEQQHAATGADPKAVDALHQARVGVSGCGHDLARQRDENAIAANCSMLQVPGLEERCLAESAEHEKQWHEMQVSSELEQSKLRSELTHAQGVVSNARESLSGIRAQLAELHTIGGAMEASKELAEASLSESDSELVTQEAAHYAILQRVWSVQAENEELMLESIAADAAASERHDLEQHHRQRLILEVEELRHQKVQHAITAAAAATEGTHHRSAEQRLRQKLTDAEHSWELQRDQLESRSAALASKTVLLDDERRAAEADLQSMQLALQALVASHADSDRRHSRELEAARQRARSADREPQRMAAELQAEVNDLRAQHARMRQGIKRWEALNAGLRAQVHVSQDQRAEGMGCIQGSIVPTNSIGSLSLASSSSIRSSRQLM